VAALFIAGRIHGEMRHPSEMGSLLIPSGTAWIVHGEIAGLLVAFQCLPYCFRNWERRNKFVDRY
jgi:hypothetical protein